MTFKLHLNCTLESHLAAKSGLKRRFGSHLVVLEGPERPKSVQSASQERLRVTQERPKSVPRAPKSDPRAPQERPRALKSRPRASRDAPENPLGSILRLGCLKKRLSKASYRELGKEARSTRLCDGFRIVCASAITIKTCKNTLFSQVFRRLR